MNRADELEDSIAYRYWSGLLAECGRRGFDLVHVTPRAGRTSIQVHDASGWHDFLEDGEHLFLDVADLAFYAELIPTLKAIIGRPNAAFIAEPGARCQLRVPIRGDVVMTVITRRASDGEEEAIIEFS